MAVTLTTTPSMNKRWPPLADKSSLPYRLTTLSKQKLAREATAPDPDIRRCLGHFRLHCTSMEWAQREMTSRINSFEFEDDDEEESEQLAEEQEKGKGEQTTLHVSFEVVVAPETKAENEVEVENEKETRDHAHCREMSVQRKSFWPTPAQCLPLRVAG